MGSRSFMEQGMLFQSLSCSNLVVKEDYNWYGPGSGMEVLWYVWIVEEKVSK